jgi:hypothetical protein
MTAGQLRLEYVPLSTAVEWDWLENPKSHDLGGICDSIMRYGFRDPPEYDGSLDAFAQGNGRVKALAHLYRQSPEPRPQYIGLASDGEWAVPVLFGADSASAAMAKAYAIDANNLTLTGGDAELHDLLAMYDREQLADIVACIGTLGETFVTLDEQAMSAVCQEEREGGEGLPQDTDGADVVRWSFVVEFEAPREELDEMEGLLGPYFKPYSRRKILPDIFKEMLLAYCAEH